MKVLHVIPSFGMGGAERVVLNYLKFGQLPDTEMRAVSLCPPVGCENDKEIKEEHLPVTYLEKGLGLDLKIVKSLKRVIREYDPDIIHTHLYALKYVLLTGECKKRKVFHTIHSLPWTDAVRFDQMANRFCFQTGKVQPIALHKPLEEQINQYYKIKNTKTVQNGINLKQFEVKDDTLREKLGIPQEAFIVGHIGSFKEAKNHIFLLNVFKAITEQRKDAYLILVGDGEYRSKIEEKIKELGIGDRVLLVGNRRDISEILHVMDVFLFPSLFEGLPMSVLEAQAAGVRCVMSDAVPIEAVATDYAVRLSLDTPIEVWVNKVLDDQWKEEKYKELSLYDISCVIQTLIAVYRDSL